MQVSTSGPAGASARAELGLEDDFYSTSAGQREKALASTDRLNKTGDRIQHGRQQLLETEVRMASRPPHPLRGPDVSLLSGSGPSDLAGARSKLPQAR